MKKLYLILPLTLILCFMFGCQDKEAMAELGEFRAQKAVEKQNKALESRMWEAWGKGDFEAFKELLAPDFAYYKPSGSTKSSSIEEVIEIGKMIHSAFPDITFSIEELIAEGDRVVVRFIITGTHSGEWFDIPATGNKFEHSGISISRIENGKVVEGWREIDMLGLYEQLGMELKPKEGKK